MKARTTQLLLLILFGMVLMVPQAWAKDAHNYIVAYSFRAKVFYYTPTFTTKVDGVSYNKEEYVSDTEAILEMEDAFKDFLKKKMKVKNRDLTVSARVAYKSDDIAKVKLEKEIDDFRFKGFTINEIKTFEFDK